MRSVLVRKIFRVLISLKEKKRKVMKRKWPTRYLQTWTEHLTCVRSQPCEYGTLLRQFGTGTIWPPREYVEVEGLIERSWWNKHPAILPAYLFAEKFPLLLVDFIVQVSSCDEKGQWTSCHRCTAFKLISVKSPQWALTVFSYHCNTPTQ